MEGRGVEEDGAVVNERAGFAVDARHAGTGPLDVAVFDEDSNEVDVVVSETATGLYECSYMPADVGRHSVNVSYGHASVPQSPFKVRHTHTRLTALFRNYPGEPVPEK